MTKKKSESKKQTEDEKKLAEKLATRQQQLDAESGEPSSEEQAAPAAPEAVDRPEPPTSPAPTIGTETPVEIKRDENAGPLPILNFGRLNPIGKRATRQRERAERRAT